MLEQSATVVDVRQRKVVVETLPQSTCGTCAVKKGCGTSVLANSVGRKVIHFELENTVGARVGDRLVLGLPEDAMLRGSLLIYLMPLGLMIVAALAADALLGAGDAARDLKIAAAAILALGASILLGRFGIGRSRSSYSPVILRKEIRLQTGVQH